ncbi:YbaB/EbfC family nucleoid-associated protein [Actinophytocola sp. NPDC049390]|uniref:YbaB/EbfC family nucleoid-associated protein n=1 Tax=Actinophytocola sp. NPDC049390 TaxID=3363894 RepID=UPI00378E6662
MPDPIHTTLADIQSSLTTPHTAESQDGTVRAEATAKHQTALHLTPAALKLPPTTLATLILTTQQEAQRKAEAALTTTLNTFREDPRVTKTLETLQDTQATPPAQPKPQKQEEDEDNYVNSVYNSDQDW